MLNHRDRVHSDIPGDFVLHFFEHMLVESFSNPLYKIDEEEFASWNPDNPRIFKVIIYVKQRYKLTLDPWNKDTGGSSWTTVIGIQGG